MKRTITIIVAALALAGCNEQYEAQANQPVGTMKLESNTQDRITVERIGKVYDNLAYGEKRGIYIIKDRQTGAEYIGVSGIGITEVGQHNCGKACTRKDER